MNRQSYKNKRQGQPKKTSEVKGSKRNTGTTVTYNQPQLHNAYNTKTEWTKNVIPKTKE